MTIGEMILPCSVPLRFQISFYLHATDAPIPFFIRKMSMNWTNVGPMDCRVNRVEYTHSLPK